MRVTLQCFRPLTYNVNNTIGVDVVETINTKLRTLLNELQDELPQGHGLLIRPHLRKEVIRSYRVRFTSKRLNLLPKCTIKKKRFNAKYQGRVGRKASMLKKVNVYNVKYELTKLLLHRLLQVKPVRLLLENHNKTSNVKGMAKMVYNMYNSEIYLMCI